MLSTIRSARGREWDAVFVLNVTDGCIPSDMPSADRGGEATAYIAMTRAKQHLQPRAGGSKPLTRVSGDGRAEWPRQLTVNPICVMILHNDTLAASKQGGQPMANYQHMLKRKGHPEYEPSGYSNIPPWKEGDERRVTIGDSQLCVRVIERLDRERVIYTEEIESLCVVER